MDSKYVLGVPEIDAQHEEISALVSALQEVIGRKDRRHLIHPTLRRLNHLLVTHFEYEESLMQMVGYSELAQHRKMHRGVLRLFDDYFAHPPAPGDYEYLGKLITDKVLGHVMEHDSQMTGMVKDYLATFRKTGSP
jgi:hemerythrin-like metal-binding protein